MNRRSSLVILAIARARVAQTLDAATAIHDALAANATAFPTPVPPLATLSSLIQAASSAAGAVKSRTGSVATRQLAVDNLMNALDSECAYVQTVVNATPEQAAHLASLASMHIAQAGKAQKPALALALGPQAGTVVAKANATLIRESLPRGASVTYSWRCTADGGKTYVTLATPVATATFTGLALLTTYEVQVCATTRAATTAWSQAITIVTH